MRTTKRGCNVSDVYQSLAHSKWDCKYHVVFVPKRRRKAIFGHIRSQLGAIFHALAKQKECQIVEGHLMPDHVHMCIAIPPKHPVASVIGFLKRKSAIAIARLGGKERNFSGEHFWARGYAVSNSTRASYRLSGHGSWSGTRCCSRRF
jgi:putative transposase